MTHLIKDWQRPAHVMAVQTTNSLGSYRSFDIHPNQSKHEAINQLMAEFNLPHEPIFLQQVHGNQVLEYTEQPKSQLVQQADACFTRKRGVICSVMTADCLPVLLTDKLGTFVAAIHCGWRSLYADILKKTVNQINSKHPLLAWFGPCIQQLQYEVDEPFIDHYLKKHPNSNTAFSDIKAGKSSANLYLMAQIQLNELDIQLIDTTNQCTFLCSNYYSWRQNNTTKRMASLIWLSLQQLRQ